MIEKIELLPLFLLIICLCLSQTFMDVEGRIRKSITEDDDLELERQLKIINKPANITIQTSVGDVYACVDIHHQPAFNHPMLKNHKVQMKPSYKRESSDEKPLTEVYMKAILERINCPEGTVPIKRVGKEELLAEKYFSESLGLRQNEIRPSATKYPGLYRAVSKLSDGVFRGAGAQISVEKLNVAVNHYSASHIWVTDDADGFTDALWAGWMVSPSFFNDTGATRLFIHWSTKNSGCFNIYCSGFVATSKSIAVGAVITTVSGGGHKYIIDVTITQEDAGNWLLIVQNETVGYWPKGLVPALNDGASNLMWGGLTYGSDPNEKASPMGNGLFPNIYSYTSAAFFAYQRIFDYRGVLVGVPKDIHETIVDCPNYSHYFSDENNSSTLYGGPGGTCA